MKPAFAAIHPQPHIDFTIDEQQRFPMFHETHISSHASRGLTILG